MDRPVNRTEAPSFLSWKGLAMSLDLLNPPGAGPCSDQPATPLPHRAATNGDEAAASSQASLAPPSSEQIAAPCNEEDRAADLPRGAGTGEPRPARALAEESRAGESPPAQH